MFFTHESQHLQYLAHFLKKLVVYACLVTTTFSSSTLPL